MRVNTEIGDQLEMIGLPPETTDLNVIKKAFKAAILQNHPDKNPDDPSGAAERARKIIDAYKQIQQHLSKNGDQASSVDASEFKAAKQKTAKQEAPSNSLVSDELYLKVYIPIYRTRLDAHIFKGEERSIFDCNETTGSDGSTYYNDSLFLSKKDIADYGSTLDGITKLFERIAEILTSSLSRGVYRQVGIDAMEAANIVSQHSHYKRWDHYVMVAEVNVRLVDIEMRTSEKQQFPDMLNARENEFFSLKKDTKIMAHNIAYIRSMPKGCWHTHPQRLIERIDPAIPTLKKHLFHDQLWGKTGVLFKELPKEIKNMQSHLIHYEERSTELDVLEQQFKSEASAGITSFNSSQSGFFKSKPTEQDSFRMQFLEKIKACSALSEVSDWLNSKASNQAELQLNNQHSNNEESVQGQITRSPSK